FYSNINQLNLLIEKLNTTTVVPEANKNHYLGIAYGMRAFYYFQLYRTWGKTIIQTEAITDINLSNLAKVVSSEEEVMALIKQDIETSLTTFGTDYSIRNTKSFWLKPASQMLKAEVYLWTAHRSGGIADAAIAKAALTAIQSNITFSLLPSYADVFKYTN